MGLPPDTTKWYYGSDDLVDSVYQSSGPALGNSGMTHLWYGSYAQVDSLKDPQGHRQRFAYEGTWGNVSEARSDSILGKCPGCQQTIDTTTYTYDVTGRVQSTHQGATGRSATVFRDRIARDTMVIDTAHGGSSAITTKTRYNDASRTLTVIDGSGHSVVSAYDVRGRLITQTDPRNKRDSLAYDGNDRVTSWKTRRNQTITYGYDALSRVNLKVAAGDTTKYGYHGTYGTLDTIINPSAAIYQTHNSKGWLTQEKTIVNGVTRIVSYGYDANGILDSLTDPWSEVYSFGWDAANRARTVTNPYSESFSIRHSSEGMVSSVYFPAGHDAFSYDASHLIKSAGLSGEVTYTRDTVTKGFASIKLGG
jgi:YD repeat-containing protein